MDQLLESVQEKMRNTPPERLVGIFDHTDTSDLQTQRAIVAAERLKRELL